MKKTVIVILGLLLLQTVSAWKWDSYKGTTQWQVQVIEDETGCGGQRDESSRTVSLEHNFEIVDVGDLGHGTTRGTFTGNIIHVPSRKIRDGKGYSTLSDFDILFDDECTRLDAKYYWDYQDSYSRCSGYTEWHGTKTGPTPGCPEPVSSTTGITDIRKNPDIENKEREYSKILEKDPKNFWANWDMAELKKKTSPQEYFKYFNAAISNENIYQKTRKALQEGALERFHLLEIPSKDKSPILRLEDQDINKWNGGVVGGITIPPVEKNKKPFSLWALLFPDSYNAVNKVVGLPEEEQ